MPAQSLFGRQLKYWRQVQGLSQLSLATLASTTTRHVSFLENGKSRPSDGMVRRLAEALEVPVRERNQLLQAAGFAGTYPTQELGEEASVPFMDAIKYTITSHAPYPAIVKNRYHEILDLNEPAKRLFMKVDPSGMQKSMLEWILEPTERLKSMFVNYQSVAWGMIFRIRGEAAAAPNDKRLQEMAQYAEQKAKKLDTKQRTDDLVMCPTMIIEGTHISMMGMVARFGSAQEANLDEVRVELMHPRNEETEAFFRDLAKAPTLRAVH